MSPLLRYLMSEKSKSSWDELFSPLAVNYTTLYRRLIRTQQHYLGICSEYVQPGDRVCILFGAQVPSFSGLSASVGKSLVRPMSMDLWIARF